MVAGQAADFVSKDRRVMGWFKWCVGVGVMMYVVLRICALVCMYVSLCVHGCLPLPF